MIEVILPFIFSALLLSLTVALISSTIIGIDEYIDDRRARKEDYRHEYLVKQENKNLKKAIAALKLKNDLWKAACDKLGREVSNGSKKA